MSSLMPELLLALRQMHFSDVESDRLISLEESEAIAIARHLQPMIGKLIGDAQASEGELMRQAGYEAGFKKGYRQGRMFEQDNPDQVLRDLGFKG